MAQHPTGDRHDGNAVSVRGTRWLERPGYDGRIDLGADHPPSAASPNDCLRAPCVAAHDLGRCPQHLLLRPRGLGRSGRQPSIAKRYAAFLALVQTYTNPEVIAIDQDALGRQAQRLVGGPLLGGGIPLHGPAVALQPCGAVTNASLAAQRWVVNATGSSWITTPSVGVYHASCGPALPILFRDTLQGLRHDTAVDSVPRS